MFSFFKFINVCCITKYSCPLSILLLLWIITVSLDMMASLSFFSLNRSLAGCRGLDAMLQHWEAEGCVCRNVHVLLCYPGKFIFKRPRLSMVPAAPLSSPPPALLPLNTSRA